jgi:hypothetical protein
VFPLRTAVALAQAPPSRQDVRGAVIGESPRVRAGQRW